MGRHLITSALPYINGVKHLGNLIGSMLPSDVYARFLRARGEEVLLICATDEHGTPAELAALDAGLPVDEFCRRQHDLQVEIGARFGLSFDEFGRTSAHQNHELTQHMARRLDENGYIEERTTTQIYSVGDGRFLPDRYVIGTCPHCGYTAARGDQCENCTRLLDPTQLIEPRSAVSGDTRLELRESRHLYLLQSKLAGEIRAWLDTKTDWPALTTSIAYKWLDGGLEDRGITRDLKWGVPVDRPGFEDKVFYVWFDAPIGYIGATKEWSDADPNRRDFRDWWYDAPDVRYTQFMAKDNVPFHTVSFPATLLGSREPWTKATYIKSFNWLTYYGGKFSTSRGRGVFMDDALALLPADQWRYFLVANAPETGDSDFTWPLFQSVVNTDLANTFGNFVNRTLRLTERHFGAEVPAGGEPGPHEAALADELDRRIALLTGNLGAMEFRKAAGELRAIWTAGDVYLTRAEPWQHVKADRDRAAVALRTAINAIRVFALVAAPVIPQTADAVAAALGLADDERRWPTAAAADELARLEPGRPFTVPPILFEKITDDQVAAWTDRFGGEEA